MERAKSARQVALRCKGHANIRASHGKTLEFTRDTTVTRAGTCILGVAAQFDVDALMALRGPLRIRLRCGDERDELTAHGNPVYRRGDPIIIRKRRGTPPRTFATGASKAASEIDRALIDALTRPGAELSVEIEEAEGMAPDIDGALFVVAAPIGNPDDFSRRALDVLQSVDLILAEDTRSAKRLLSALAVTTPIKSYHEQNEETRAREALALLQAGQRIALMSEAGAPTLSDPGYHIVDLAHDAGIVVTPVPGPSAITAALSVSGLGTADFRFVGFLPRRRQARRKALDGLKENVSTLVLFEAPHRVLDTLADVAETLTGRRITICRDMTKDRETVWRGDPIELRQKLQAEDPPRGEFTLVVEGRSEPPEAAGSVASWEVFVRAMLDAGCATKIIAAALAASAGISRREAFAEVVRLKDQGRDR